MSTQHALNILFNVFILAIIASLVWWLAGQFPEPIGKWVKIIACVLFIFVLLFWLTGGMDVYPFLR